MAFINLSWRSPTLSFITFIGAPHPIPWHVKRNINVFSRELEGGWPVNISVLEKEKCV
ncbi:MAG: hypothetical protein ACTSYS_15555 [Promethearchaeota archaeon]